MVKAKSQDGVIRKMVFNEDVLLANPYDELTFSLEGELNLNIVFEFSDEGKEYTASGGIVTNNEFKVVLHNWYHDHGVENTMPVSLKLKNGKSIWIKYRTSGTKANSFRRFHLTVWMEE
ncbi:DUF6864 domain-containing function [Desertivirga xinjiangensis]|uniref:DUF6864 domain-containing function n=1 Tax=Desertivirga xinjiangensis TaxID=539206 RepID=UPI00210CE8E7|nr:hypothetical protein [Pedobacter xinjiangensis]